MSELLWVAVPGGTIVGGEALLRVLVVPRLQGPSLSDDGMQNWPPQQLVDGTLEVDFGQTTDGDLLTVQVGPPHIQPQPGVWESFFGPETIVRPFRQKAESVPEVQVTRSSEQATAIRETFEQTAKTEITTDPASLAGYHRVAGQQLQAHWGNGNGSPIPQPQSGPARTFEPPDFHRTVSFLREHPSVLRALGLIIDLRFPASAIPAGFAEGFVQVRWPAAEGGPPLPTIVSPWTRYEHSGTGFFPLSGINISSGMVTLSDDRDAPPATNGGPRWEVTTVDVDGGATRMRDAARAVANPEPNGPNGPDEAVGETPDATLPALRTAGLLLLRRGRQDDFVARRRTAMGNAGHASMTDAALTAEDLVLGYRIDVKLHGGDWFSLCQRRATYRVGDDLTIGLPEASEEGHVKANAAVDDGTGVLRADEVVARWSGWSLVLPPPNFDAGFERTRPSRGAGLPFDFEFKFLAQEGSLPQLRFATTYRLRARVADMAGGGLMLDDSNADRCATEPVTYQRFEPVASPGIALPEGLREEDLGPAESVHQVVIRSDLNLTVAEFAAQNPRYRSSLLRTLSRPQVDFTMAEQHGMLNGDDEETWEMVRDALTLSAGLPDPAAGGVAVFPRRDPGELSEDMTERAWSEPWPRFGTKSLELADETQGERGSVSFVGDRLVVRLAPAEQVTLEVSSFLTAGFFDHFAVGADGLLSQRSKDAANLGRHPMVTPARAVTLTHAVRRPIREPSGALEPHREPGQTSAILEPEPAVLDLDPHSTVQLDLTAAWTEHSDDQTSEVTDAPVQSVTIGRGDEALVEPLRHDFADTRHRNVTYTVTGQSRYRQFFDGEEDEASFRVSKPLPLVNILSSARPAPPVVLSTSPAFVWEQEDVSTEGFPGSAIRRRRLGGRLRVELQRPWHVTGEGERLAAVTWTDSAPPPTVWPSITQVGRDPIWETAGLDRFPTAPAFTAVAGGSETVPLVEAGVSVVAVPHEVWFRSDRWFADIALPAVAAASYCPFVQLAVARFQPDSLDGLKLSPVVRTEMVPLLPDRALTVDTVFQDIVSVTLEGLGPAGPRANRVDVIVEQCTLPPGMSARDIDLTAVDPPSADFPVWVTLATESADLGTMISLELPPQTTARRVRVREVELVGRDGEVPAAQTGTFGELSERTVFTDVLVLPLEAG